MSIGKFNGNLAFWKGKDVRLLAIAGVSLLVFIGILFWLFSEPSESELGMGNIVPTNVNQTVEAPTPTPPPILDERALENTLNGGQSGFAQESVNGQTNAVPQTPSAETNLIAEANRPTAFTENDLPTNVLINNQADYTANGNRANEKKIANRYTDMDMKDYLNSIKREIVVESGVFYYKGKIYKKGDVFNALNVVDVNDFYIRFASEDWEYNLRFVEGSK